MINISNKNDMPSLSPFNSGNKNKFRFGIPIQTKKHLWLLPSEWVAAAAASQPKDFILHFWLVEIIQN